MSTCHWCHVMERESFEDEEVAELLNRHFVSIKVDREERPDIDHIYMTVCQAMTGQGGWPLTIIMTPDKKPFFAGTYFPKTRRFGRVGLMDVLGEIAEKWAEKHENIVEYGDYIAQEVQKHTLAHLKGEMTENVLDEAFQLYEQTFDSRYGGFGRAPKFPIPHNLTFLLRYYRRTKNEKALHMAEKTLECMHRGGMYDHIGFGFARYSTDERWLVPHFEKMLYDNALLAAAYLEAYQVTGKRQYADVAEQIFTYVLRDMTDPEGGFYSAEDADSEGEEGKFYVWTPEEVAEILGEEDGERFCELYDITPEGNFEGHSIPNLIQRDMERFAADKRLSPEQLSRSVETMRQKLFEVREKRVHPHKDDKILTSWNGLMIMALAKGAKVLGNERYLSAAKRAEEFIRNRLIREDGRILARYRDGEAAYLGYIDDYAFYVWALIELYEAALEPRYLQDAVRFTDEMIRLFWDNEEGGFFFYGSDGEKLIARPKEIYDGAVPSGNSVAALNLLRLAHMTGREDYRTLAERQFRVFAGAVSRYPSGHAMFLTAVDFAYGNIKEIVLTGKRDHPEVQQAVVRLHRAFLPHAVVLFHSDGPEGEDLRKLSAVVRDKTAQGDTPAFYVCEHFSCQAPVTDAQALMNMLDEASD